MIPFNSRKEDLLLEFLDKNERLERKTRRVRLDWISEQTGSTAEGGQKIIRQKLEPALIADYIQGQSNLI